MQRNAGIYGIRVKYEGETLKWMGSLETCRGGIWGSYRAPWRHCPLGCTVEAERRATAIKKFESKAIGRRPASRATAG